MKKKFTKKLILITGISFCALAMGVQALRSTKALSQNGEQKQTILSNQFKEEEEENESTSCGGVERWSVKVFTDAGASNIDWTPKNTTIAWLVAHSVPTWSFYMPRQPIEDSTYMVTCNLTIKKIESDSDYHLVLSDGTHTMIGEIPDANCPSVAASSKKNEFIAARAWVDAHIAQGNVYNVNIPPVTITGVAFLDTAHGQTGAAPNQLELHSIIDIHYASVNGTNEIRSKDLTVTVSPNPFSDFTTLQVANAANYKLKIFDSYGREVKPTVIRNADSFIIHRNNLAAGVYILKLINKETSLYEGKLMVE